MILKPLLAVGGLATALVGLLVVEYHVATFGNVTLSAAARHPSSVHTGASRDVILPARDTAQARVEIILARPLFNPSRRPPPGSTSSDSAGPAALPRLSGVLVSPTGKSLIFAGLANGKPVVVTEGGRIGSYVVKSIGAGEAIVNGPDGTKTLRPVFGTPGAAIPVATNLAAPTPSPTGQMSILDQLRNGPPPSVGIPGLTLPPDAAASPGTRQ